MALEITLPEVPGDPAGMRVLAGALQGDARELEGIASGITSAVGSLTFDGPAADRFQDTAQASGRTLGDCAARLSDLARLLEAKAAEVEQRQRDRLARIEQLRAELAARGVPARVG
jgi:uncharacterized protein YukE